MVLFQGQTIKFSEEKKLRIPQFGFFKVIDGAVFAESSKQITHKSLKPADYDGVAKMRGLVAIFKPAEEVIELGSVTFDDDPDGHFDSIPPSPLDVSIILNQLHQRGVRAVSLSTHLAWENADEVYLKTLYSQGLRPFERVTVAAPVTRSRAEMELPEVFQRSSVPLEKSFGDPTLVPSVNSIPIPPSIEFPGNTYAGFSSIEFEEDVPGSFHLLARWDDRLLLGFPLVSLMQTYGISPDDLRITIGESIQLGESGPIVPIDERGRVQMAAEVEAPEKDLAATKVVAEIGNKVDLDLPVHSLIRAQGEKVSVMQAVDEPMRKIFHLHQMPRPLLSKSYPRLPLWIEVFILCELTLVCAWLYGMREWNRNFAYVLTACACFLGLLAVMQLTGHWTPASPIFMVLLTGWGLSQLMAKKYTLRRKTSAVDKKAKKTSLSRFE